MNERLIYIIIYIAITCHHVTYSAINQHGVSSAMKRGWKPDFTNLTHRFSRQDPDPIIGYHHHYHKSSALFRTNS